MRFQRRRIPNTYPPIDFDVPIHQVALPFEKLAEGDVITARGGRDRNEGGTGPLRRQRARRDLTISSGFIFIHILSSFTYSSLIFVFHLKQELYYYVRTMYF